ncbi:MAG: alpha-amylase family glycosyl hydrolase [Firmicutes bacterium]|nr:alpha-amylase family glycosyl hydrolase [Bacillota bacterium]
MNFKKLKMSILSFIVAFSLFGCTLIGVADGADNDAIVQTSTIYNWENDTTLQRDAGRFLGVHYTSTASTFRIWSPDTPRVRLVLDPDNRGSGRRVYNLVCHRDWAEANNYWENRAKTEPGRVYGVTVQGDLWLYEYIFEINHHLSVGSPYRATRHESEINPHAQDHWREVPDPNAMMSRAGSHFMRRPCPHSPNYDIEVVSRSIVIDPSLIVPTGGWVERPEFISRTDAVIYEMQIRDFTISHTSGVSFARRGKFLGAVERGTTVTHDGQTVSTGLDHLIELGITHVHIMPANNFKGVDFGWGYEPWNFNVPQHSFSMTPHDYVNRIYEFKTMVNEFHRAGIRVILDKVFNHTARVPFLYDSIEHRNFNANNRSTGEDSNPHRIIGQDGSGRQRSRGTFYGISHRWYLEHGQYGFGGPITGVANTMNNEHPMVERYFRDSLELWVSQYNISGFRFDLMGTKPMRVYEAWGLYFNAAIPQGQTRTSIRHGNVYTRSCFAERKIIFYGEPWSAWYASPDGLGMRPQDINAQNEYVRRGFMTAASPNAHIGVFNVHTSRRPIRGSLNNGNYAGFMWQQNLGGETELFASRVRAGFMGSLAHNAAYLDGRILAHGDPYFAVKAEQSINYLFAHDNLSAYDRWRVSNNNWDGGAHRTVTLGHAAMMFMQGIPFIFGGDEFLRSKYFHGSQNNDRITHNTHHHPDRYNAIDWTRKVTHFQTFVVFRDMIALRRAHPHFRMNSRQDILGNGNAAQNLGRVRTWQSLRDNHHWIKVHLTSPDATSEWSEIIVKFIFNSHANVWFNLGAAAYDMPSLGTQPWNLAFTSLNGSQQSESFNAGWHNTPGDRNVMVFYRARGTN